MGKQEVSVVFCCGYNSGGFLGLEGRSEDVGILTHMEALEKLLSVNRSGCVEMIVTQFSKSYFLTSHHHLYSVVGNHLVKETWPDTILPELIVDMRSGQGTTLFLTQHGNVYIVDQGTTKKFTDDDSNIKKALMIGSGGSHYWILDTNNRLHGFGELLSSRSNIKSFDLDDCLESGEGVRSIVTGGNSLVLTTTKNNMYIYGEKEAFGTRGAIDEEIISKLTRVTQFDGIVKEVVCGWYFTMVLTTQGKIYFSGKNTYNQLPSIAATIDWTLDNVEFEGSYIETIGAGSDHVLFATNTGKIYSRGMITYGQLGRSHSGNTFMPPTFDREDLDNFIFSKLGTSTYRVEFGINTFNTLSTYVIFKPNLKKGIELTFKNLREACNMGKLSDMNITILN